MSRHEEAANEKAAADAQNAGIDPAKSKRLVMIQKAIDKRQVD